MHEFHKEIYLTSLVVLIALLSIILYENMASKRLLSVDFEVYGKVQGVFFRKYTQKQGNRLGLRGWCMNTEKGTVLGNMQGEENAIKSMKSWLQETGSPQSRIDKCEFSNEQEITDYTVSSFVIRK